MSCFFVNSSIAYRLDKKLFWNKKKNVVNL